MGKGLYDNFPEAKKALDTANDVLGFDLKALCFYGPEEELTLTKNAQPAILAVSAAALEVLRSRFGNLEPELAAGHSLGEYSALYAAGGISFEDALKAVRARGEFMQSATPEGTGAMAAVIGWDEGRVTGLCEEVRSETGLVVELANINAPDQIVVSGHVAAVEKFCARAKEQGVKRTVPLKVSAPFHSSLMKEAAEKMKGVLDGIGFRKLAFPVIANASANPVTEPDEVKQLLIEQIAGPVLWTKSMKYIKDQGIEVALEIGPGKALAGLMRRNAKEIKVHGVSSPEDVNSLEEKL